MKNLFPALMLLLVLLGSHPVHATNGYFTHGLGVKNKSMAGAGTAAPAEAMAVANNPAAAILVGDRYEIGLSIFSPRRYYQTSASLANGQGGAFTLGPDDIDSDSEYFYIPHFARTWLLDDSSAMGLAFYGRGGMNTDYSGGSATFDPDGPGPAPVMTFPGTFGGGNAGVDFSQAFLDIAYSRKFDSLVLGISGIIAAQALEVRGVGTFAGYTRSFAASGGSVMPENLSNNGHDLAYGAGLKIGAIWQVTEVISLAASYQSKISMSEFDDYSDLFAEAGNFDIPPNLKVGISLAASQSTSVHFDIERTWYGEIDSVGNSINNLFSCPTAEAGGTDLESCLGGKRGAGFGWGDMTSYKLGAEHKLQGYPEWTLRAGYSWADQPIGKGELAFNIIAPGVIEQHFTVGFSRQLKDDREFNLSFMYAPENTVKASSPFDPTQTIELGMHQFELEFGYSW